MDWHRRMRSIIVSTVVRDTPRAFWEDVRIGARRTYADVFEQVRNEKGTLTEQRLDKLYQDRHFGMEYLLATVAAEHGFACSATILAENNRSYVYVTKGGIGITQSYVPAIGAMPKPARFRERHAALNAIPTWPRLDLGDEPREVMLGKDFYGLIAHNPVGKGFAPDEQHLGMIQLCVPYPDMQDWVAQLTIEEIVAAYAEMAPSKKPDRRLPWRKGKDKGEGEGKA